MTKHVMRNGLSYIFHSHAVPQLGAGPLFSVCCWLPSCLCIGYLSALVKPRVWVAQHATRRQHVPQMLFVVKVSDAVSNKFFVWVTHRTAVSIFSSVPHRLSPRVSTPPQRH